LIVLTSYFSNLGFLLIIVGIIIILVALALAGLSHRGQRSDVKGGGIILIGPFPIIFGSDVKTVKILIYLVILIIALGIIFALVSPVGSWR